jgi:hypothetical protein
VIGLDPEAPEAQCGHERGHGALVALPDGHRAHGDRGQVTRGVFELAEVALVGDDHDLVGRDDRHAGRCRHPRQIAQIDRIRDQQPVQASGHRAIPCSDKACGKGVRGWGHQRVEEQ